MGQTISAGEQKFILHWGEMGTRWGISRAVAQIHAFLFIADKPKNAQEISEALSLARSNVSTGIRELESWGLVSVNHEMGDRRDYFKAIQDPWEMARVIVRERMERELKPTLQFIDTLKADSKNESAQFYRTLDNLKELLETSNVFYSQVIKLPTVAIKQLLKFGKRMQALLGVI